MGAYIYRVTAQRVRLTDGREANVAKYAYKPYGGWDRRNCDKMNAKMDFRSGCPASRKMAREGKLTGLIVVHSGDEPVPGNLQVYRFRHGTFCDDAQNWEGMREQGVFSVGPVQAPAPAALQVITIVPARPTSAWTPFDWE